MDVTPDSTPFAETLVLTTPPSPDRQEIELFSEDAAAENAGFMLLD